MNAEQDLRFVGRTNEIAQIEAAIRNRSRDAPVVICVSGPAGIGKTALVEELFSDQQNHQMEVHWARCWNETATPALWPWRRLLESIAEYGDLRIEVSELTRPTAANRFAQFNTIARFLRQQSEREPLTLVIDDIHWADAATLELLNFVSRDRGRNNLTIVTTYREPELTVGARTDRIVELERDAVVVRLDGLPAHDIASMLENFDTATPAVANELHQRTDGNPYFVSELVRLHQREGQLDVAAVSATPLSIGVRSVIAGHVALVDQSTRRMLEVAAVQGVHFDHRIVMAAAQLDDFEMADMLEGAARAQLVKRGDMRWRFDHALIGEALLAALSPHDVAAHHLATADAIEKAAVFGSTAELEPIANHLRAAGSLTPPDRLLASALRAADHAGDRLAWEDQADHLSTAIGAMYAAGDPNPATLVEVMLRRCNIEKLLGNHDVACEIAAEAARVARSANDRLVLADVALAYPPNSECIEIDEIHEPAQARLREEALAGLGPDDDAMRAQLQGALALSLYWETQASNRAESHRQSSERRNDLTRQALATARRLSDDDALAAALSARIYANWGPASKAERPALAKELSVVGTRLSDPHTSLTGRVWIISELLERAELSAADREIDLFADEAARTHDRLHMWTAMRWRANRALMNGDFANVESLAGQALELAVDIMPAEVAFEFFSTTVGPLQYLHGELGQSLEFVRDRALGSPNVPAWRVGLATIASETGGVDLAERELQILAADDFAMMPRDLNFTASMVMAALIAHTVGDIESAAAIERHLSPSAGRLAIHGTGYASYGAVDHALAQCVEVGGRMDEAVALYRSGIELCDRTANPYADIGRLYLGRCLSTRDPAEAITILTTARDGFRRWGLEVMAQRAITALDSAVRETSCSLFEAAGTWTLCRGSNNLVSLSKLKGFAALRLLVTQPHRAFSALELAAVIEGHGGEFLANEAPLDRIDSEARSAYQRKLTDIEVMLDAADSAGDEALSDALFRERDALTEELRSATGFGGRRATDPGAHDRARVNVTKHLKRAVAAISEVDSLLKTHLGNAVKTGSQCSYEPEVNSPFRWDVSSEHSADN